MATPPSQLGSLQAPPPPSVGFFDDHRGRGGASMTGTAFEGFEIETEAASAAGDTYSLIGGSHFHSGVAASAQSRCLRCRRACGSRKFWLRVLWDYHFLLGLLFFCVLGTIWPTPGRAIESPATSYTCPAIVFLLAGLFLNTAEVKQAIRDWPGLLFGLLSILGIVPCLSFLVPSLGIQPVEFTRGLVVFVTVPTALGTIGMLTELANGNTSLATMYGVITNLLGTITAPLWLHHTLASISIDVGPLLGKLVGLLLVPLLVGRALQEWKPFYAYVLQCKTYVKLTQSFVLLIVPWTSISGSASRLQQLTFGQVALLVAVGVGLSAVLIAYSVATMWWFPVSREVKKAFIVSVSMKTVSIPIVIIALLPDDVGEKGLLSLVQVVCFVVMLLCNSVFAPRLRYLMPSGADLRPRDVESAGAAHLHHRHPDDEEEDADTLLPSIGGGGSGEGKHVPLMAGSDDGASSIGHLGGSSPSGSGFGMRGNAAIIESSFVLPRAPLDGLLES